MGQARIHIKIEIPNRKKHKLNYNVHNNTITIMRQKTRFPRYNKNIHPSRLHKSHSHTLHSSILIVMIM
jgi:hypothetical protein